MRATLNVFCVLAILGLTSAPSWAAVTEAGSELRLDFGPPAAPVKQGFMAAGPQMAFGPDAPYGWEEAPATSFIRDRVVNP